MNKDVLPPPTISHKSVIKLTSNYRYISLLLGGWVEENDEEMKLINVWPTLMTLE
jgi:hypothetical protein